MAAREVRAAPRQLLLLTGAVAVGVAALVAIDSFTDNVRESVRQQSRALLGADLEFSAGRPFAPVVEAVLDSLTRAGARLARVTSFSSMAYVPRTSGTRLVQVAAVEGSYPFYGQIQTDPGPAYEQLQLGRRVVVEPSLLTALDARVGDTMALGEARFVIWGTVTHAPGNVGVRAAFGPRIYIPFQYLGDTKLLGVGARAEYQAYLRLRPNQSAQALAEGYRPVLGGEHVRIRTVAEDQQNLNDALSKLARYLSLVALIALLLGGLAVANGIVVFIRQRRDTIAILRCLGATTTAVFAVYAVQATAIGIAGGVVGAALGVGLQQQLPALLADLLPVDVHPAISPRAVALGLGTGVWVASVFALLPLLSIRKVPPLAALRRAVQREEKYRPDLWSGLALIALTTSAVTLARIQVGGWRRGSAFTLGIGVALVILWGAARLLTTTARRWLPSHWPYVWRQGLANLHRPANQTAAIILAVGFGVFLLATLLLVQHSLRQTLRLSGGPARPNLVLFDIQPDQLPAVHRILEEHHLPSRGPVPIVPMRIQTVNGRPASALLADTSGSADPGNGWALRREYRSTYRDTLVASERLVEGRWWTPGTGSTAISVETGVARELGVRVGDSIVWDVQGVPLTTRVASLREVDWARFEPNFFVVFQPGALEQAPQSLVTLTRVEAAEDRGMLQRQLAEQLPNVTTIDLSAMQEILERLIGSVVLAIRFMALFTLGTGLFVLGGALATSRFQRMREGALLRTLGATERQLARIVLAEYLALGFMSSVAGAGLALLAAGALMRWVFDGRFGVPLAPMGALMAGVVGLTVVIGLANSRRVIRRPPLAVLRAE